MPKIRLLLCGGNILDKYAVKSYARAYRDLNGIYRYISENFLEPETADKMIEMLEEAILGLENISETRSSPQNRNLRKSKLTSVIRQKLCHNLSCAKLDKEVHIVTIRYVSSQF